MKKHQQKSHAASAMMANAMIVAANSMSRSPQVLRWMFDMV